MTVKQVIVMRRQFKDSNGNSMKLRRGKEIAQAGHATIAWALEALEAFMSGHPEGMCISSEEIEWMRGGQTKVTVYVNTEEELVALYEKIKAVPNTPPCFIITDSGKTEFGGVPTKTCMAFGPGKSEILDQFTGHLPLY